jgi:hypothetical protein
VGKHPECVSGAPTVGHPLSTRGDGSTPSAESTADASAMSKIRLTLYLNMGVSKYGPLHPVMGQKGPSRRLRSVYCK